MKMVAFNLIIECIIQRDIGDLQIAINKIKLKVTTGNNIIEGCILTAYILEIVIMLLFLGREVSTIIQYKRKLRF